MIDVTQDKKALLKLQDLAAQLIEEKTEPFERQALIRNSAMGFGLSIRDGEIFQLTAKARAKLKGTSSGELPNQEIEIPEESWLCDQLFADGTLTILTALQKVGKSSFISAFLGCLTYDSKEFLGQSINAEKRPIIIVGTDQPLCDWREILVPCGLMKRTGKGKAVILDPIVRLWHKGNSIHLDEKGIEEIVQLAEENKNSIVVLDAFASLISSMGLDENKPEATEPLRFLTEALPTHATPILLHHSSKSRSGERASNAARGSNALTAEASQIIKMDWFSKDEHDQRVAISTEGRNSTPIDLVIEQTERSQWISHGSTRSVKQEEKLAQKEKNLNERQGDALEEARDYWRENYKGIDSKQLQEAYPEHFDTHKKALSTLKQLENRGFLKSTKEALKGRGEVRLFQPSV
tara:strand:- start:2516 stop:3739 length:1224 start_codon:yes stop_codon:yes gene_type:complete